MFGFLEKLLFFLSTSSWLNLLWFFSFWVGFCFGIRFNIFRILVNRKCLIFWKNYSFFFLLHLDSSLIFFVLGRFSEFVFRILANRKCLISWKILSLSFVWIIVLEFSLNIFRILINFSKNLLLERCKL